MTEKYIMIIMVVMIMKNDLYVLAHEVKNPLAICSGYLEMISREKDSVKEKMKPLHAVGHFVVTGAQGDARRARKDRKDDAVKAVGHDQAAA